MKELYNSSNNLIKINIARFVSGSTPMSGNVLCQFKTKVNFHPSEFTTSGIRKTKSFFKHALRTKLLFNLFCKSRSKFNGLYFFSVKNSAFKFRKRGNMYFAIEYNALPQKQIEFFLALPKFIEFLNMISLRLFKVYGIKSGITKVRLCRGFIDIYILNAHLMEAFISNRPIDNVTRVFRLSIFAEQSMIERALYCIYGRRVVY